MHWCSRVNHEFSFLWRFWRGRRHCTGINGRVKRSFVSLFWAKKTFSPSSMLLAHLSWCKVSSYVLSSHWERTDCAREVHTFECRLAMDPFLFLIFMWCHVPLVKLTGWFDPKFPSFRCTDFSRMRILRHATQWYRLLQWGNWSFPTSYLRLFTGLPISLNVSESTFVAILHPDSDL